jgi:hypothetical protein
VNFTAVVERSIQDDETACFPCHAPWFNFEGVARLFRHLPLQCIAVGIGGDGGLRAVLYETSGAMLVNRRIWKTLEMTE